MGLVTMCIVCNELVLVSSPTLEDIADILATLRFEVARVQNRDAELVIVLVEEICDVPLYGRIVTMNQSLVNNRWI